jgi:predicted transcriptional regulator
MDEKIIELYNANVTTAQIAAQLDIPQWQVADTLARLRSSGVLTKRKRTTEAEARQLLTEAGADFTALATFAPETWQPEAARLLDAGIAPSQVARFTAVSKARVCAWAKGRQCT